MLRLIVAAIVAIAAPVAAPAQAPRHESAPGIWTRAGERVGFPAAGIGFPQSAGAVRLDQIADFGQRGSVGAR